MAPTAVRSSSGWFCPRPRYRSLSRLRNYQRSEQRQVFHVLVQIGRLGRLQTAGQVSKASIVDDVTKSLAADFSLANPGVTIHARAEVGFGIVEMKGEDAVQANQCIDFRDGGVPPFGRADVVAGGEQVRRVQANSQPLRPLHLLVNRG